MAYLLAPIPYFRCLVRREYLRDLQDGHGDFLDATAIGVLCVRGDSLHFQVVLHEPLAGCSFLLPIEALVTREVAPVATKVAQPWDCASSDFGVCELTAVRRMPVKLLKDNTQGVYLFTVAATGTDVADDPAQRKMLHVVSREDGIIGAYPNNRVIFVDRAMYGDLTEKPDFMTLTKEFRAEGMSNIQKPYIAPSPEPQSPQDVRRIEPAIAASGIVRLPDISPGAPLNGVHSDPKERPDWVNPRSY